MKFADFKIGTRLSISFSLVLSLLLLVAVVGWSALSALKQGMEEIINDNDVKVASANAMRGFLNVEVISTRNVLIYNDPAVRASQKERISNARKQYDAKFEKLAGMVKGETEKQLLSEISNSRTSTRPELDKVVALADSSQEKEGADYLRLKVQGLQDAWFKSIQGMIDLQELQNRHSVEAMQAQYTRTLLILLAATLAALAAGVLSAWLVTRSIVKPLNEAVQAARQIADGNLGQTISAKGKDETAQLLQALGSMNANLLHIVGQVRIGTDTIATGSTEISSGNMDLSARTEQQASALEETASAIEQFSSTVKQNAENARQANQLATSASQVAISGGKVVSDVVTTMDEINASSRKIVDIISVIDGIAFQTNILALNAAVEAARAGEQGRGFAVVATEVRALAQRSAAAAKEIKQLIDSSVSQVDAGSNLVEQAGTTMNDIVQSVKRVTDIVAEISAASQEQSIGIEQINLAITQMDVVTQQNSALVEQAAAASQSMQEQASKLSGVVGIFKLGRDQQRVIALPAINITPSRLLPKQAKLHHKRLGN